MAGSLAESPPEFVIRVAAEMTGAGQRQLPPEQTRPLAQAFPHPPQWVASLVVSTQVEPHSVRPAWLQVHWLAVHDVAAGHALPQAPQLFESLVVSTQAWRVGQ
jgi:hypothetical protein